MSRVAIVTGGGTGIGAGVAKLFAAQGLNVVLVGRRPGPLDDVRAAIGGRAHTIAADVGAPDAPARIVEETLATFGRIDVIVNNAAIIQTGRLESFSRGMFDLARRIPLQRMGEVVDIAARIWFLVAPESRWTTGNFIHVDGGQVLGLPAAAGG